MGSASKRNCESDQIGAYLDGELDECARNLLEEHVKECCICRADLAEQQRLLCALDLAFLRGSDLPLPGNFAKSVATYAECDLRGMRDRREYWRALLLCGGLAIAAFALLGVATASRVVLGVTGKVAYQVSELIGLVWSTVHDAFSGLAVISRMMSRGFIPASNLAGFLALGLLTLAILLLSRLISGYHRARPIE